MQTTLIPLGGKHGKGMFLIIDSDDFPRVSKLRWHLSSTGYPRANIYLGYSKEKKRGMNKAIYIHNLILGKHESKDVDHINRNKLDNRKENLRFATRGQNMANAGMSAHNTSGIKGVSWHKQHQKWCAITRVNGKNKCLGLFNSKYEASRAYRAKINQKHKIFTNKSI